MDQKDIDRKSEEHFAETGRLVTLVLLIWAAVSYGGILFVKPLNSIVIAGFPLGYYMGSQGSLIVFVLLIFYYARQMDLIDRKYGVEE